MITCTGAHNVYSSHFFLIPRFEQGFWSLFKKLWNKALISSCNQCIRETASTPLAQPASQLSTKWAPDDRFGRVFCVSVVGTMPSPHIPALLLSTCAPWTSYLTLRAPVFFNDRKIIVSSSYDSCEDNTLKRLADGLPHSANCANLLKEPQKAYKSAHPSSVFQARLSACVVLSSCF